MTTRKILLLDIGTAPGKAYIWSLFDSFVPLERLIEPGRIISWGAKWHGQKEMFYADERKGRKRMLVQLAKLLSEADAVVTFNGDKFDLTRISGELVLFSIKPPPPVTSIDLYKVIRKFGFQSGKLAFVAPYLGIGSKIKHAGFSMWAGIMNGDEKAWDRMRRYNLQDVRLLGRLYVRLLPYISNHPHLSGKRGDCPNCGSSHLTKAAGPRRTRYFLIERLQCQDCGAWSQGARRKII